MEVKDAAEKAATYLKDFYPDAQKIRLEEIEISENDGGWFITLSFDLPDSSTPLYFMNTFKNYKIFKIDNKGEVKSMKIREIK